jgi:hypothetical protein
MPRTILVIDDHHDHHAYREVVMYVLRDHRFHIAALLTLIARQVT